MTLFSLYCCRYIFPGLALGAALGQTGVVTNAMINRAAEALVELINEDDLARYILDISTQYIYTQYLLSGGPHSLRMWTSERLPVTWLPRSSSRPSRRIWW